jgi:two-component system CheB/CheR fusion protein
VVDEPAGTTPGAEDPALERSAAAGPPASAQASAVHAQRAELHAVNRDAVESVEVLCSVSQELEAALEEATSINEQLTAANDALELRVAEAARLHDELIRALESTGIALVLLDRGGRVRRFTPPAAQLFPLLAADVGRPFADLASSLGTPTVDLAAAAASVMEQRRPAEHLAEGPGGRWRRVAVHPYVAADGEVDGAAITIVDVGAAKWSENAFQAVGEMPPGGTR